MTTEAWTWLRYLCLQESLSGSENRNYGRERKPIRWETGHPFLYSYLQRRLWYSKVPSTCRTSKYPRRRRFRLVRRAACRGLLAWSTATDRFPTLQKLPSKSRRMLRIGSTEIPRSTVFFQGFPGLCICPTRFRLLRVLTRSTWRLPFQTPPALFISTKWRALPITNGWGTLLADGKVIRSSSKWRISTTSLGLIGRVTSTVTNCI